MVFSSQFTEHYHTKAAALPSDTQQSTHKTTESVIQHTSSIRSQWDPRQLCEWTTNTWSFFITWKSILSPFLVKKYITLNGNQCPTDHTTVCAVSNMTHEHENTSHQVKLSPSVIKHHTMTIYRHGSAAQTEPHILNTGTRQEVSGSHPGLAALPWAWTEQEARLASEDVCMLWRWQKMFCCQKQGNGSFVIQPPELPSCTASSYPTSTKASHIR
jgi:hypothetical protein